MKANKEIPMPTSEFMNVRQAADALGVHENTIRNWEEKGLLHGIRLPGSGFRRFPKTEIDRMRAEMFGSYAPTTEITETPRKDVSGRSVEGDII
jgi:excisionase family DNA binding protein